MDERELREILQRVARGELDADEATRLLDETNDGDAGDAAPTTPVGDEEPTRRWWPDDEPGATRPAEPPPGAPGEGLARALRVSATARKIRIVGDPSVREILARGAQIRREDDVLVVDCEPDDWSTEEPWARNFAILRAGPWSFEGERHWERRRERMERAGRRGGRGITWGGQPVEIRANPDLDLSLDMTAGAVRVSGMRGKITTSITAGSATFGDVRGPLDCSVSAGSVAVAGPIDTGDSRISCDMGSVRVRLEPGSDVRVKVDSVMSKADVVVAGFGGRTDRGEWVVGDGTATLAITANMGAVKVREEA